MGLDNGVITVIGVLAAAVAAVVMAASIRVSERGGSGIARRRPRGPS